MNPQTKQTIGWTEIILGILVALTVALEWPIGLLYLWAVLVFFAGLWELSVRA